MQTVTVKEREYHIGKVNAMRQLHLVRRMAPITGKLKELVDIYDANNPSTLLEPLGKAMALLPDADVDYIMHTCLEAVTIKQAGGGFAPVFKGGVMMFDIDLATMLALAAHVIRGNLGSFFSDLSSLSPATQKTESPLTV